MLNFSNAKNAIVRFDDESQGEEHHELDLSKAPSEGMEIMYLPGCEAGTEEAMKPIEFPEQTTVWAKNQPPYLPLPAYSNERETISCWRLTWIERLRVLFTGRLWLRQLNFGTALQPQRPSVESPFIEQP